MAIQETFKGLLLVAAVSLAVTAPAIASPVGDQYLPQAPTATGDEPAPGSPGAGDDGPGAGGTGSGSSAGSGSGGGGGADKGVDSTVAVDQKGAGPSVGGSDASSTEDEDSAGLLGDLFEPLVVLLIAGVLAVAAGTILARRHGDRIFRAPRGRRERPPKPPTPDGEIVAGRKGPTA